MDNSKCNRKLTSNTRLWRAIASAVCCSTALLITGFAGAANWEIDPIRIELSPEQQTATITLKNASDKPTSLQIEVVAWSQLDGKDIYTESRELMVSPPIVTIPANGEQVIRAALRRSADSSNELSYRINLQELTPPPTPNFTSVQVAMRIGLPVFVQSQTGSAAPKMTWNVSRMSENTLKVGLTNKGNAHVQVTDFSLFVPGDDKAIASESGSSYIMAGQKREWLLKSTHLKKIANGRLHLKAYTDAGDIDTDLVLGKP